MNVKISEMPSATSLDGTELVPIVQSGVSKNVTKQILTNNNYSTTEHIVGTWIDGKPLYEKTIKYTTALTSSNNIPHNVSNISMVFVSSGFIPYGSEWYSIFAYQDGNRFAAITEITTSAIILKIGSSWASAFSGGCSITIRYTKSTD